MAVLLRRIYNSYSSNPFLKPLPDQSELFLPQHTGQWWMV